MKLTITIQMDNAAFEPDPEHETICILTSLAVGIREDQLAPGWSATLQDSNGNTVGKAKVTK